MIEGCITPIQSEEETKEIENVLSQNDKYKEPKEHLKKSIKFYTQRQNPDFTNSIKESICAVESLTKIITNKEKVTLGEALKILEKNYNLPNSLKEAFSKLYGYASNEGGIRHGLISGQEQPTLAEARFMLITCSAFINYIIEISKQ